MRKPTPLKPAEEPASQVAAAAVLAVVAGAEAAPPQKKKEEPVNRMVEDVWGYRRHWSCTNCNQDTFNEEVAKNHRC